MTGAPSLDVRTDHLVLAYCGLLSVQAGLDQWPGKGRAPQEFAIEYGRAIDHLEAADYMVQEFRLPPEAVGRNASREGGEITVDAPLIRMLVTKALKYFELSQALLKLIDSAQKSPADLIGFQASLRNK